MAKKNNSNPILYGLLVFGVVLVLAGTLVSLNTLSGIDFTGDSLTGAVVNKEKPVENQVDVMVEKDNTTSNKIK